LKTTSTTLPEFENDIRSKIKLQENVKMVLHYKENGKFFVLDDLEDLEDGMTIKVSISTQPKQDTKIEKKIDGKNNFFFFFFLSFFPFFSFFFLFFFKKKKKK